MMMEETDDVGSEGGMDDSSRAPSFAMPPGGMQEESSAMDTQSEATSVTTAAADPFDLLSMSGAPAAPQPPAGPAGGFDVFGSSPAPEVAAPVVDLWGGGNGTTSLAIDVAAQDSMIAPATSSPKLVTAESGDLLGLAGPSHNPPPNDLMDPDFQTMPVTAAPGSSADPFANSDLLQAPTNVNSTLPDSNSLLSMQTPVAQQVPLQKEPEKESAANSEAEPGKASVKEQSSGQKIKQPVKEGESNIATQAMQQPEPQLSGGSQPEESNQGEGTPQAQVQKLSAALGAEAADQSDVADAEVHAKEEIPEEPSTADGAEKGIPEEIGNQRKSNEATTNEPPDDQQASTAPAPDIVPPEDEPVDESTTFEEVELVSPGPSGDEMSKMANEEIKAAALATESLKPPLTTNGDQLVSKTREEAAAETKHLEEQRQKVAKLEAQLAEARKEVETLQNQKSQIEQQHKDSQEETATVLQDLQNKLQEEQKQRAEAENKNKIAGVKIQKLQLEMEEKEKQWEHQSEAWKQQLTGLEKENEALIAKAKQELEDRKEHERRERVLANKLNTLKKQQASKTDVEDVYEDDLRLLREDVSSKTEQIEKLTATEADLKQQLEQEKTISKERIEQLEKAVREEKQLNEERKKKMKAFIETKAEELKEAKEECESAQAELNRNSQSVVDLNNRWKTLHAQWVQSQTRNRELQRDLNKIKKDSENLHKVGDSLNVKLSRSANETEQHKNKRLAAKQELMSVLGRLEAEREITNKLRDSIRFTFTAKAQSQHQLLQEALAEFKKQLEALATRLGKPIPLLNDGGAQSLSSLVMSAVDESEASESSDTNTDGGTNGATKEQKRILAETTRLLAKLENETQHISQSIMTLSSAIEQMNVLIHGAGEKTCFTSLGDIFFGGGMAKARVSSTNNSGRGAGGRVRYGHSSTMPTESGTMA